MTPSRANGWPPRWPRNWVVRVDRSRRAFDRACAGADVVCATTHSPDPVVLRSALDPGAHVNVGRLQHRRPRGGLPYRRRRARSSSSPVPRCSRPRPRARPTSGSRSRRASSPKHHIHAEIGELVAGDEAGPHGSTTRSRCTSPSASRHRTSPPPRSSSGRPAIAGVGTRSTSVTRPCAFPVLARREGSANPHPKSRARPDVPRTGNSYLERQDQGREQRTREWAMTAATATSGVADPQPQPPSHRHLGARVDAGWGRGWNGHDAGRESRRQLGEQGGSDRRRGRSRRLEPAEPAEDCGRC